MIGGEGRVWLLVGFEQVLSELGVRRLANPVRELALDKADREAQQLSFAPS